MMLFPLFIYPEYFKTGLDKTNDGLLWSAPLFTYLILLIGRLFRMRSCKILILLIHIFNYFVPLRRNLFDLLRWCCSTCVYTIAEITIIKLTEHWQIRGLFALWFSHHRQCLIYRTLISELLIIRLFPSLVKIKFRCRLFIKIISKCDLLCLFWLIAAPHIIFIHIKSQIFCQNRAVQRADDGNR